MISPSQIDFANPKFKDVAQAWLLLAGFGACKEWLKLMFSSNGDRWMFFVYLNGYNDQIYSDDVAPWDEWFCFSVCVPRRYRTHERFMQWRKKYEAEKMGVDRS